MRLAVVLAVVAAAALWMFLRTRPPLRVTFLDVGQGDAVLIQAPGGKTALVDAGRGSRVVELLRDLGVSEIDLLVASHAHADHIGGMDDVLNAFTVRAFMDNGLPHTTQTYDRLMEAVENERGLIYLQAEPRTVTLGGASIEVLPLPPESSNQNHSVALVARYGDFSVLLSGDSETGQLRFLTRQGVLSDVTVLKAPHHGAANGVTPEFLAAVRPEVVVVSVGNNAYGHPSDDAMSAYEATGAAVFRTDSAGTITVSGRRNGRYDMERR